MPDFIAVTARPVDPALYFISKDICLRPITPEEQIAIEDRFFRDSGLQVALPANSTVFSIPEKYLKGTDLAEFRVAIEFALAVLCNTGLQNIRVSASFGAANCIAVGSLDNSEAFDAKYPPRLTGQAICEWLSIFMTIRQKIKDHMHVTADRFVRYARGEQRQIRSWIFAYAWNPLSAPIRRSRFVFPPVSRKSKGEQNRQIQVTPWCFSTRCALASYTELTRANTSRSSNPVCRAFISQPVRF